MRRMAMMKPPCKHHGVDQPKSCPKTLQKKQRPRKTKRNSFFKALVSYLNSDSYMYGPLLSQSPATKKMVPKKSDGGGTAVSQRGASNSYSLRPSAPTVSGRLKSTSQSIAKRVFHFSSSYQSPQPSVILPFSSTDQSPQTPVNLTEFPKLIDELLDTPISVASPESNRTTGKDALTDQEDDSRSWSATESYNVDEDFLPLYKEAAEEVAQRLVRKLGGRYSKELGMYVDILDSEVDRWFLATTFVNHPSNFELSKHMFKKLQNFGISKILDVLSVDQSELGELFESTIHKQRMASRLLRLANVVERDHNGSICSFKHVRDYMELKRELENLPGYGRNAARLFIRELRGVWPGANPEIETRTKNAARHLHLVPEFRTDHVAFLSDLAERAGLDVRDLELALVKLGLQHARQYKHCPGGVDCDFLRANL